jgi:hypothetical protein
MVTNHKIEKKKSDIAKTETRLAEVKAKLREQKQELIDLENEEIVAMFRKEVITEDDLKALMRSRQESESDGEDDYPARERREEKPDALS